MKFAVCSLTLGDDYKKQVHLCTKSQEMHAARHGYDRITDESIWDRSRAPMWSKIPLLQKYLSEYDYLVWMDGDVLITNQETRLEEFIEILGDKMLLVGRDFQGLNNGVFIIRNCPLAFDFLKDVWTKVEYAHVLFHEQSAMDEFMKTEKYKKSFVLITHKYINILNAFDYRVDQKVHWVPGDFCIHFAGIHQPETRMALQDMYWRFRSCDPSGKERIEKFKLILENYKKTSPALFVGQ